MTDKIQFPGGIPTDKSALVGAIVTACQFLEFVDEAHKDLVLDQMDLSDEGFEGDLKILQDSIGYRPGETYSDDE